MNDLPQTPGKPEALHYLGAIKVRLESLYELLPDDPRLREHISDELDWIEGEIERISAAPLPRLSDESAGDIIESLRRMPSSLNGALRIMEEAASYIERRKLLSEETCDPAPEMIDAALIAWFKSPPSETDQGLERSMKAALIAALALLQTESKA